MCGIFGSSNFKNYKIMYEVNKIRGNFAYGGLYTTLGKELYIRKRPGEVDLTDDGEFVDEYNMFLGHTQAPTSVKREFSPRTSHPFEDMYHLVAHNGVLENYDEIVEDYLIAHLNAVDSSVIPALIAVLLEFDDDLTTAESHKTQELVAIERCCEMLKGTFACWIYGKLTGCTYLVRSGSTLFGNHETGDFSSMKIPGMCEDEIEQGIVYCVTTEGLAKCGKFKTNNPFFL